MADAGKAIRVSADDRRDFYLSHLRELPRRHWTFPRSGRVLITSAYAGEDDDYREVFPYYDKRERSYVERKLRNYTAPIREILREHGIDKPFAVVVGDTIFPFEAPVLCKSRPTGERGLGVLCRLNVKRHWLVVDEVDAADIPWREKTGDRLLWRGAFTGMFGRAEVGRGPGSRYYIAVNNGAFKGHPIDVGFTALAQVQQVPQSERALFRRLAKQRVSLEEQLQHKYLLALEGNDVSSGLKWMLHSNSVVIMPQPTCESWACEPFLQPFVHYVPVRHDLADLAEVFRWCRENDGLCEQIAGNGREFVAAMRDADVEKALMRDVVLAYVDKVDVSYETGASVSGWAAGAK